MLPKGGGGGRGRLSMFPFNFPEVAADFRDAHAGDGVYLNAELLFSVCLGLGYLLRCKLSAGSLVGVYLRRVIKNLQKFVGSSMISLTQNVSHRREVGRSSERWQTVVDNDVRLYVD